MVECGLPKAGGHFYGGSREELRQGLPSDEKRKRKAAVYEIDGDGV